MFSVEVLSDKACFAASQAAELEFTAAVEFALDSEAHKRFGVPATEQAVSHQGKETIPQNTRRKMEWHACCLVKDL